MNRLLVQLELHSGLGTPLAADTLWGHLAWGMRYRHGEKALKDWLAAYSQPEPPLVLSDPFPSGFLPRPVLPWPRRPEKRPDPATLDAARVFRKREWIDHASWRSIADRLSPTSVELAVSKTKSPPIAHQSSMVHAAINRLSGGTAQEGGGTLYSTTATYFPESPVRFDVWIETTHARDQVNELFTDALSGGYGRDASSGLGHLTVASIEPAPSLATADANAGMLLGLAVPRPSDPATGWFAFDVRAGRLGGDFAIGSTPSGSIIRQKRPVYCLTRGSLLVCSPVLPFIGRLVNGVHEDEAIRHYGLGSLLPCRIDPAFLAEVRP